MVNTKEHEAVWPAVSVAVQVISICPVVGPLSLPLGTLTPESVLTPVTSSKVSGCVKLHDIVGLVQLSLNETGSNSLPNTL